MSTPETDDFAPSIAYEHAVGNQRLLTWASIINSALLLTCLFVAGLLTGNTAVWRVSLCAMALCYVTPVVQITFPEMRKTAGVLAGMSIIAGGVALILLAGWMP